MTQVFADPPKAAQVIEGDFVAGVITAETQAKPQEGFNVYAFPEIADSGPVVVGGGDVMVMFKDNPAARALIEYLATPEAAEIWAAKGGFSSPNKNVDPDVYPDELTKQTATALANAEVFRFDMSDLHAGRVRQRLDSSRCCRTSSRTRTTSTGSRRKLEAAAETAFKSSRRGGVTRVSVADFRAESPSRRLRPRLKRPGWRESLLPLSFLGPALFLLVVWVVYPTLATIWRSLFNDRGDEFVWFDNYERIFSDERLQTAIKNNALWVLIVPAAVTAVGLVFAVLTERIRWSVAFKIAVFMPLAISLFAVGVIWRIMYQQDPERGAINAAHRRRSRENSAPRESSPERAPSTDALTGSHSSGVRARAAGRARRRSPARPDRDPRAGDPRRRRPGRAAGAAPGRDHRRRLERLQARRRRRRRRGREPRSSGFGGATVELRDARGGTVDDTTTEPDGTFAFEDVETASTTSRSPVHVRGAVQGVQLARRPADHAGDHVRLHLGVRRASRW